MAQKRKPDQTKLAAEAALFLAGKQGWDRLSLAAVAKKAKLPLKTVEASFDDAWDILAFSLAGLEKQTSAAVDGHLGDNWRDNLMEILMMRFELAQADREAYAAIGPSALRDPTIVKRFAREFYHTLDRMLQSAGLPKHKCQPAYVAGFGAVYLSLVDTWLRDKTPDLSKTMAAIDKRIDLLEQAVALMNRQKL